MNEMIERVARAICCPKGCSTPDLCCSAPIIMHAKAAILALHEPTELMICAMAQTPGMVAVNNIVVTTALRSGSDILGAHCAPNTPLQQAWRAGIIEALK